MSKHFFFVAYLFIFYVVGFTSFTIFHIYKCTEYIKVIDNNMDQIIRRMDEKDKLEYPPLQDIPTIYRIPNLLDPDIPIVWEIDRVV